ncbi:GNAT family N-acetyltransferase [Alkalihalobacillus sp. CinArs1]|uniref:GNAT family N-acetyltransferase n=1 Tax=Alkalihalobacillus sp. CinArs1 TaxID=2995314 RepID=UPI0022DE16FD|nr:GNAT family N-acetyltransferase [Alkalihalobacillus sp. CinArs1]
MMIRKFHDEDIQPVIDLFYDTVHTINSRDYSYEQIAAWANPHEREQRKIEWLKSLRDHDTYVAVEDGIIIGFSDLTGEGVLDLLYVHKDYQRQGVATALVNKLLTKAKQLGLQQMTTEASITAKPFFERQGFQEVKKQQVKKNGVTMVNYKMVLQV